MINNYITDDDGHWRSWLLITDYHWSPPMITYDQFQWPSAWKHTDGLVQHCSTSIANTLRIQGPISMKRCGLTSIEILMLKIRWSRDRLIFNMEIAIPGEDYLYIETGPCSLALSGTMVIICWYRLSWCRPSSYHIKLLSPSRQASQWL